MKNENGITLVSLVTIVIVIIIIATITIYTGVNSYKVIDIQKYKSQMQMIQNELDELYEEYANYLLKNEEDSFLEDKGVKESNKITSVNTTQEPLLTFLTNNNVGLNSSNILDNYYYISSSEIEEIFNLEEINISEYFIINFEKRYLFSVTPIIINEQEVYSLYQLEEEQKVIDMKTNKEFEYIIYKEENKQIIEISHDINIEKIELQIDGIYTDIRSRKDYCRSISYLNTKKVTIEILKDCKIKVTDAIGEENERQITFYNTPILEKNMIPIKFFLKEKGVISYINDPKWYDYVIEGDKIDERKTIFAVAINAITTNPSDTANPSNTTYNNYYKVNISDTVNTILNIPTENDYQAVKLWIPKNLINQINNTYGTSYMEEAFEGTGMWVEAKWHSTMNKWVLDNGN